MGSRLRQLSIAALLACCIPAAAFAQPGFHSVYSRDGNDAWAVGDAGVYYRSLDGGQSWSTGTLGSARLRDVVATGLTIVVVGDGGNIWRSTNSGGAWANQIASGAPDLRAISMPTTTVGFVVGANGTILKTMDGGTTWTPKVSGTARRLNAVHFADEQYGWSAGENGTLLATSDGGDSWTQVSTGTTREFFSVMQRGMEVWAVGAYGTALRSANAGASFAPIDLKLDAHSDVRSVWLESPDSVYLVGGGGFIRRSADRGQTWMYPVHNMHGQISDVYFAGATGFVVSNKNRLPMSSIDRGTTWRFPTGATLTRSWVLKQPTSQVIRGNSFGINAIDPSTIYCGFGKQIFTSHDEGETWTNTPADTFPVCQKVNAFIVSPKDTNVFLAAVSGVIAKRIVKSDDHGATWYTVLTHDFGEYGIPLDFDHDHPDTIYFGGEADGLMRSMDGGKNWERISDVNFRSPCDIVVVPDSSNVILVGDGVTGAGQGELWKSRDGGLHFFLKEQRPAGASEIPGMSNSRLRPGATFSTNWGSGGVQRTTDFGEHWPSASSVTSAWGTDIAKDDPNLVIFGVYSGGNSWLSVDGGVTFTNNLLSGSNYSFYLRDRGTILALQSAGVYKMMFTYSYTPNTTQSAFVMSPNGGEVWNAGTVHDVQWSSVSVPLVNVEMRPTPGEPWIQIAQVPGYQSHYSWAVPNTPSNQAKVRVRDAWDATPEDSSNATFTIIGAATAVGDPTTSFALWQNRPNPFSGSTQIAYALPTEMDVDLEVYDLQGQRVATLVRGRQSAGVHSVAFGRGVATASGERLESLPSGVYFYRLQAGSFGSTRKLLLLH
jgi:photosystem II stability/assembly factor-like uncharacterized protein